MWCNNNFDGKYSAIVGPKLSGQPRDPDYRGSVYRGTTVLWYVSLYTRTFILLGPNIRMNSLFQKTFRRCSSLRMIREVSQKEGRRTDVTVDDSCQVTRFT